MITILFTFSITLILVPFTKYFLQEILKPEIWNNYDSYVISLGFILFLLSCMILSIIFTETKDVKITPLTTHSQQTNEEE